MKILKKFPDSLFELKSTYTLAAVGMLLALRVIVGYLANSTLPIFNNTVKISINFLPIAVAALLFGPVSAALVGGLGDVISFFLNPTGGAYFPGFTLNGILTGLILGIFLYKNNCRPLPVIISWTINALFVEVFLSGYWLYFIYGAGHSDSFLAFLWIRAISEAIKFVPTVLLIIAVGKAAGKIKLR